MINENNNSGGAIQNASGDKNQTQIEPEKKDVVAYETHQKLLSEKKKLAEKLAQYEAENNQKLEAELKAKEDYKKLLELRENEKQKIETEYTTLKSQVEQGRKLSAFLGEVNGEVQEAYWQLIDLDKVIIDPVTNLPDKASVQAAAREFETKFSAVIASKNAKQLPPNNQAMGGVQSVSYDQWKNLSAKEMKAQLAAMVAMEQKK